MKILIELGTVILNALVRSKLEGNAKDNFVDIITMLKTFGLDDIEARSINRGFEKIADDITVSCKKILESIYIDEDKKSAILNCLVETYSKMDLSIADLLQNHADEDKINKILLNVNTSYKDNLDEKEKELYERLLEHTSHLLVNAYMKLPEFNAEGIKRLNVKMDEITEKIDDLLSQMDQVNNIIKDIKSKNSNFERQYRNKIISQNSYIYLFGAGDLASEYKKYQLSIAYVELEIFETLTGKKIKTSRMFEKSKNIWLSGDAGSGKTTFLQWIAVKSAENDKDISGLRNTMPILIRLRKYDCAKISLRDCISEVMKDSSYGIPEGWIEELIESGRFVFLIDGFDEVSETDRRHILDWLKEIDKNEKCIKIYTARPQVKERPNSANLIEADILPMNRVRIKQFINYWHVAVLDEQLKIDKCDAQNIANGLFGKITLSDSIMKLAATPLLCAMICALHYRNEMNLPTNKRELYEECCKMLIERRDKERGISQSVINLNYEQKKIILSKLAYWMMKNNYVEVERNDALKTIKRSLDGMSLQDIARNENEVFNFLLERCGILREPEKGKIDFIHRTFQEYLTAFEISREEDWGVIQEKIGSIIWQETIGLAIGYAKKSIATKIIRKTLHKGNVRGEDKKYLFLAISYLNGAVEVDRDLRQSIEQKVSQLIPPTLEECTQIAEAGDLAVQFLSNNSKYSKQERISCLRTLKMAGTIKSLSVSKTYYDRKLDYDEVHELGGLYGQFTRTELIDSDIPNTISKYILEICDSKIILNGEMVNILNFLGESRLNQIRNKNIKDLEIVDYFDDVIKLRKNIFSDVRSLEIYGNFGNLNFLKYFANIRKLKINNTNMNFSIYDLNYCKNLYKIKNFGIIIETDVFITGKDLPFLSNCEELEIILLNNVSEFSFCEFNLLKSLRKLTVGAPFVLELDFDMLPNYIESLTILAPEEDIQYAKKYIVPELNIANVNVKKLIV